MSSNGLSVSEVARLSGVSVRTLHHYDEIGLFSPAGRTAAGYRVYDRADLLRLQQILFYRELGFPLEEIRRIVADPAFDRRAALREQRRLLTEKILHFQRLLGAIDRAIDDPATSAGTSEPQETHVETTSSQGSHMSSTHPSQPATPTELFEVFGQDVTQHEPEVEQRWGDTEAFRESKRRTATYTKEQWQTIKAEADQLNTELAACLERNLPPTDPAAMDLAERHRLHIDRWFYPCSHKLHACISQMYVSDPRFAEHYEAVRPGLAAYVTAACQANAGRG